MSLIPKICRFALFLFLLNTIHGCESWIYRVDIPQGNYIDEKEVKKLRINMTRAQVEFVLGKAMIRDSFDHQYGYYIYYFKAGDHDELTQKKLIIKFENDRLSEIQSDYLLSPDFNTPLAD